ncbi:uncharacterized protein TNCV_4749421 [Trichonephila clavipes]|nr:uncharacterized protein TNCV_4749421 [Trichonephila clavipes]
MFVVRKVYFDLYFVSCRLGGVVGFCRWPSVPKVAGATSAPGQPIGVTVHFTQQPIREQPLSSQPKQKLFKTHHPDKAQKPHLSDPIIQPIAVMPPSRTKNPTFAMPLIEDLSRNGIEDCSYSPEAQKKQRLFNA